MRLNLSDEPVTAELLAEGLRRTGSARIAVNGTSMHPTLPMGWRIHLRPATGDDLRPGEIAVFRTEHHLTVHRLVWIERGSAGKVLVFRGDYNRLRERVPPSAVLARVVAIEVPSPRHGYEKVVPLEGDALSLFYGTCWAVHRLLGQSSRRRARRGRRRGSWGARPGACSRPPSGCCRCCCRSAARRGPAAQDGPAVPGAASAA